MGIAEPSVLTVAVNARKIPKFGISQRIDSDQMQVFPRKIGQDDDAFHQWGGGGDALDCLQPRKEGIIDFTSCFQMRATRYQIDAGSE
jgi:hypothetical protein